MNNELSASDAIFPHITLPGMANHEIVQETQPHNPFHLRHFTATLPFRALKTPATTKPLVLKTFRRARPCDHKLITLPFKWGGMLCGRINTTEYGPLYSAQSTLYDDDVFIERLDGNMLHLLLLPSSRSMVYTLKVGHELRRRGRRGIKTSCSSITIPWMYEVWVHLIFHIGILLGWSRAGSREHCFALYT